VGLTCVLTLLVVLFPQTCVTLQGAGGAAVGLVKELRLGAGEQGSCQCREQRG
jgi:hypothetical protein